MNCLKICQGKLLMCFIIFSCNSSVAQSVGISAEPVVPDASAMLDIKSTTKGLLIPRMQTGQRLAIASPANGLTVYDTDLKAFFYHDGTGWKALEKALPAGSILLSDAANNVSLVNSGFSSMGKAVFNLNESAPVTAAANSWQPVIEGFIGRTSSEAIEAGNRIAIWGGYRDAYLNSGAFYDPLTDEWEIITRTGAPSSRTGFAMIWTGTELVIWGGYTYDGAYTYYNDGARYNVAGKTWTPLNTAGAPTARGNIAYGYSPATNEMIIWGGFNGPTLTDGAKFNFTTNTWTAINSAGNPGSRFNYASAMGGDKLFIWGGYSFASAGQTNTGYYYSLGTGNWTAIPTIAAGIPAARENADGVWTGSEFIVWGGSVGTTASGNGGKYNPGTNSWTAIPSGPVTDFGSTTSFENNIMLTYGINGGALYNNGTNTWSPLSPSNAPESGRNGCIVSSANGIFLVWGGKKYGANGDYLPYFDDGGRYFRVATPASTNVKSLQSYYLYKKN